VRVNGEHIKRMREGGLHTDETYGANN
jgi:hypothetical protein